MSRNLVKLEVPSPSGRYVLCIRPGFSIDPGSGIGRSRWKLPTERWKWSLKQFPVTSFEFSVLLSLKFSSQWRLGKMPQTNALRFAGLDNRCIASFFDDGTSCKAADSGKLSGMIIAIDGPSGAGKSTLGKMLAKELGLLYLDTGAMYRAAALAAVEAGVGLDDAQKVSDVVRRADIKLEGEPDSLKVLLDGQDVTTDIRTLDAAQAASIVSTISDVRSRMVELQRSIGEQDKNGCVLEGRDIGSVVFPNADIKFFLTAKPEARARRRFEEDKAKGRESTYEKTLAEINERDQRDVSRDDSPLIIAEDAVVIDTSDLDLTEVFEQMLAAVRERENASV